MVSFYDIPDNIFKKIIQSKWIVWAKENKAIFLIHAITFLSIFGVLVAAGQFLISDKLSSSNNNAILGVQLSENYVQKNDTLRILALLSNLLHGSIETNFIQQHYQAYLALQGESISSQDLARVGTTSFVDYYSSLDPHVLDKAKVELQSYVESSSRLNRWSFWLILIQIIIQSLNIIFTILLFYEDREGEKVNNENKK